MTTKYVCIALALIAASACGGGGSSGPPAGPPSNTTPPVNGISVSNNTFSPAAVTVTSGTTVVWAWNTCTGGDGYGGGSETCVAHNVLFDDGVTSGLKDKGTFSRPFSAAGTYGYHCTVHQTQGMTGSVVVQ